MERTEYIVQSERVKSLDGVRGLAILMVLIGHAVCPLPYYEQFWQVGKALASLGTYGVDLFFVLSGYLITNVLEKQKEMPGFIRAFWIRRAARIYPLYLAVLVILSAICAFWVPDQWPQIPLWAYPLHLQNFFLVAGYKSSHFGYDISWSLAIEDHFYLIYPLLFLLKERTRRYSILAMLVGGPIMRHLTHPWIEHAFSVRNLDFFMLSGRIDQLALGALLAMLMRADQIPTWIRVALQSAWPPCFLWCIVSALHFLKAQDASITALASASTIMHLLINPDSALGSVLKCNGFVFMGRISYALYLVHSPFVFIALRASDNWIIPHLLVGLAATLLTSYASTRYFEEPISQKARGISRTILGV